MPFRDNQGHLWQLPIDFPAIKRVRQLLDVDLIAADFEKTLQKLADPITLIDTIYAICKPEADRMGLNDVDFGCRMAVDLDPIVDQLLGGLADFFQSLGRTTQAQTLRTILNKSKRIQQVVQEKLTETIEARHSQLDQTFEQLEADILRTIGGPSTSSPALPESIRTNQA